MNTNAKSSLLLFRFILAVGIVFSHFAIIAQCSINYCGWLENAIEDLANDCDSPEFAISSIPSQNWIELSCFGLSDAGESQYFDCFGNLITTCTTTIFGTECTNNYTFPPYSGNSITEWSGDENDFPSCDPPCSLSSDFLCLNWVLEAYEYLVSNGPCDQNNPSYVIQSVTIDGISGYIFSCYNGLASNYFYFYDCYGNYITSCWDSFNLPPCDNISITLNSFEIHETLFDYNQNFYPKCIDGTPYAIYYSHSEVSHNPICEGDSFNLTILGQYSNTCGAVTDVDIVFGNSVYIDITFETDVPSVCQPALTDWQITETFNNFQSGNYPFIIYDVVNDQVLDQFSVEIVDCQNEGTPYSITYLGTNVSPENLCAEEPFDFILNGQFSDSCGDVEDVNISYNGNKIYVDVTFLTNTPPVCQPVITDWQTTESSQGLPAGNYIVYVLDVVNNQQLDGFGITVEDCEQEGTSYTVFYNETLINPTPICENSPFQITFSGQYSNSCGEIISVQSEIINDQIDIIIYFDTNAPQNCNQAITDWEHTIDLNGLSENSYELNVYDQVNQTILDTQMLFVQNCQEQIDCNLFDVQYISLAEGFTVFIEDENNVDVLNTLVLQPNGNNFQLIDDLNQFSTYDSGEYTFCRTYNNSSVQCCRTICLSKLLVCNDLEYEIDSTQFNLVNFFHNHIGASSYTWSFDDGTTVDTSQGTSITHVFPSEINIYKVCLTSVTACDVACTECINITIGKLSLNTIVRHPSCPYSNDGSISINLENLIEPIEVVWSIEGDNDDTVSELPVGEYSVYIKDGLERDTSIQFYLEADHSPDCIDLYDPATICQINYFTPNNDSYNETLEFKNLPLYAFSNLIVFNNWGKVVYEQENYSNDWAGLYNGSPLPDGVYYYVLDYGLSSSTEFRIKSDVTIIRER